MRIGWVRESNVSMVRIALWYHFLPPEQPKMRLGWGRESYVSSGRQTLRTHFLPVDQPKNSTWVRSRNQCFRGSHFTLKKRSAYWPAQYATWMRSRKGWFKMPPGTANSFFASWQPKTQLGWSGGNVFSSGRMALWTHFILIDLPKIILVWIRECDFSSGQMLVECLSNNWNIVVSNSHKLHFGMINGQKMCSKLHGSTWNLALSTSCKSHFGLVKGQKMSSKCHLTTWNIALPTSPKSPFVLV